VALGKDEEKQGQVPIIPAAVEPTLAVNQEKKATYSWRQTVLAKLRGEIDGSLQKRKYFLPLYKTITPIKPMSSSTPSIQLPFSASHAFIIGINDYQHLTPLATAVNDAKEIARRLREQHQYTVHSPLLNATKADITKLLSQVIPQTVGKDDRVVFYFAGHGIALDSEEGPNGYLVPADARSGDINSLVSMQAFHQVFNELPCRHGLLILDCCFAGAFKWSSGFRDVVFDLPSIIYEERFWRYVKDPAWQVITSTAHDQKAVDVLSSRSLGLREEGNSEHSPFAQALFEGLEGQGDVVPQEAGDGVITATELYMYIRDEVENDTTAQAKRQTPSLFNLARHNKGEFIFLHPSHRLNLPPAPNRNPFMGLSSYNEKDATLFFGRGRVVEALLAMIPQSPLLVVSGASGTGKSSVIKAGLLPRLRKEGWQVLSVIRPGKEPMLTLQTELSEADRQMEENGKTVLVVDQYEELITQCQSSKNRQDFEQQLSDWLKTYPKLRIVLSIRSDFEPQFEQSALTPWWKKGRYIVPAFSLEEYREIIVLPANQEVLFYEPESLVDRLVEEVSQAPGALPLLSFTLSELYEAYLKSGRQDRALIESDYEALGGVIGALRTKADEAYSQFDAVHQNTMRQLMLRMVSLEGGELAGKRVFAEELQFSEEAETQRAKAVAEKLVAARLILRGTDGQERIYIEPAHDALVRAWARLWEWVKATGEEKLSLYNKLSQAVKDYQDLAGTEGKKAHKLLWNNNPSLELLKAELQSKNNRLNAREEAFVRKSLQRRNRLRQTAWGIALVVIIGLSLTTLFALQQQRIANKQRERAEEEQRKTQEQLNISESNRLGFQANMEIDQGYYSYALLHAMEGYQRRKENPDPLILRTLSNSFQQLMERPILFPRYRIAFDSAILSIQSAASDLRLQLKTPEKDYTIDLNGVPLIQKDQQDLSSKLQITYKAPMLSIRDENGALIDEVLVDNYESHEFSPDHKLLLALSKAETFREEYSNEYEMRKGVLWNLEQKTSTVIDSLGRWEFSPDSRHLVNFVSYNLDIIDLQGNRIRHNLFGYMADYPRIDAYGLSFSPDGSRIAVVMDESGFRNWTIGPMVFDLADGREVRHLSYERVNDQINTRFYSNHHLGVFESGREGSRAYVLVEGEQKINLVNSNTSTAQVPVSGFQTQCLISVNATGELRDARQNLLMRLFPNSNNFKHVEFFQHQLGLATVHETEPNVLTIWTPFFSSYPLESAAGGTLESSPCQQQPKNILNSKSAALAQKRASNNYYDLLNNNMERVSLTDGSQVDMKKGIRYAAQGQATDTLERLKYFEVAHGWDRRMVIGNLYFSEVTPMPASTSFYNGSSDLIDAMTGASLSSNRDYADAVGASNDASRLFLVYKGTGHLWDTKDRKLIRTINFGHNSTISAVAIAPDQRFFLTGDESGFIRLWDQDINMLAEIKLSTKIESLFFEGDDSGIFYSKTNNQLRQWYTPHEIFRRYEQILESNQLIQLSELEVAASTRKATEKGQTTRSKVGQITSEEVAATIKSFLKAEDSRDFEAIYHFYAPNLNRYWHLNQPTKEQLAAVYTKAWASTKDSRNTIQTIEAIDETQYKVTIDFTFLKKGESQWTSTNSVVFFTFDENGKITAVRGVE
jgi:WD40 repeat protein